VGGVGWESIVYHQSGKKYKYFSEKQTKSKRMGYMTHVVQHLPGKKKASNTHTHTKESKQKKRKRKWIRFAIYKNVVLCG
jgi:signal recognition particle GTPase